MSKQLDWEAYRYVLDDPTLDRTAFEARMLDDVKLALAVAEAMLHVDSLRAVSNIAPPEMVPAKPTAAHHVAAEGGWNLTSLAALAAALMLAIGLVNYRIVHTSSRVTASVPAQNLAESWLAIRQTEIVDQSSNLVDVSTNTAVREDDPMPEPTEFVGVEQSNDNDWLMDAAREFYAQGDAG